MTEDAPQAPPPDLKDWTWVLNFPCSECGLDTRSFSPDQVPNLLRRNVLDWVEALDRLGEDARLRPRPDTWSPLEYACHVRDVHRLYSDRLALMLAEDGPHFENWDQNVTAVEERYDQQDPTQVARELAEAGAHLADEFESVTGDQWNRTGIRSDGADFTVATFARYYIHDPIHHLWDINHE